MEHNEGSGKPPEQNVTEDPLWLSGICKALTMVCICHGSEGIATAPCHPSHPTLSFYFLVCCWFRTFSS